MLRLLTQLAMLSGDKPIRFENDRYFHLWAEIWINPAQGRKIGSKEIVAGQGCTFRVKAGKGI